MTQPSASSSAGEAAAAGCAAAVPVPAGAAGLPPRGFCSFAPAGGAGGDGGVVLPASGLLAPPTDAAAWRKRSPTIRSETPAMNASRMTKYSITSDAGLQLLM